MRFSPKLFDCLKDYDRAKFALDLGAGVTVGVIALPLAIGFAIATSVCVAVFHPDVATIGSRFGGIPRGLPALTLPAFDFAQIRELTIPAMTIAMLLKNTLQACRLQTGTSV